MAKIILIEHDCGLLESITGKLRQREFQVEPICAETPLEFLMEITEAIYGHKSQKAIVVISDYHLPGIKGIDLIRHAQGIAGYLDLKAMRYGIMTSDHTVHLLPGMIDVPIARKDSGLQNLIGFVESLAAKS